MVDWDKRYREATEPPFGTLPSEYLRQVLARSDFEIGSALCLADGDGRNGRWLAGQGRGGGQGRGQDRGQERGIEVTAVDLSQVATAQARIADGLSGIQSDRIAADLTQWTPDEGREWDAVILIALHAPWAEREALLHRAVEWIRPGGFFVIEGFSARNPRASECGPADEDRLWNVEKTLACFPGFEVVEAFEGQTWLNEGPRHQGTARMVRILVRKPAE